MNKIKNNMNTIYIYYKNNQMNINKNMININ